MICDQQCLSVLETLHVTGALYGWDMQAFYLSLKVQYVLAVLSPFAASFPPFVLPHLSQYAYIVPSVPLPLLCGFIFAYFSFALPHSRLLSHSTFHIPCSTLPLCLFFISSPLAVSSLFYRSTHEAEQEVGTGTDQDSVYVNIADDLKCIADQVDTVVAHFDGYFEEILMKEDPDAMTQAFLQVGGEVFRSGITIQRIFVLLLFGYKLVKYFLRKMAQGVAQLIPADVTNFIILAGKFICEVFVKYKVLSWVREQGGWQNLAPAVSWTSVAIFAGVVLAAVGFVARIWK